MVAIFRAPRSRRHRRASGPCTSSSAVPTRHDHPVVAIFRAPRSHRHISTRYASSRRHRVVAIFRAPRSRCHITLVVDVAIFRAPRGRQHASWSTQYDGRRTRSRSSGRRASRRHHHGRAREAAPWVRHDLQGAALPLSRTSLDPAHVQRRDLRGAAQPSSLPGSSCRARRCSSISSRLSGHRAALGFDSRRGSLRS